MKKKILKIIGKVFLCFLVIYLIYVIGNVIYANKKMHEFEIALNNNDFDALEEYDGIDVFDKEKEFLKKFDYHRNKTYYILGRLIFEYEISIADSKDVLENGVHIKELLGDFETKYIEERQILKNIAQKTREYSDFDETISFYLPNKSGENYTYRKYPDYLYSYIHNSFNFAGKDYYYYDCFSYPFNTIYFDKEALYNLLEATALSDEKEYAGNKTNTLTIFVKYNIFTREFEDGLASFCAIKYGQELLNEATYMLYDSDLSIIQELIRMHKKGEEELRVIRINDKVVSVYENFAEYKGYEECLENKFEKYILENNFSVDEAITYLKTQGYKLGRSIVLRNSEYKEIELVFDGEDLLWIDKTNMNDEEKEKVNYFFENNIHKDEIISELENMGYYEVEK